MGDAWVEPTEQKVKQDTRRLARDTTSGVLIGYRGAPASGLSDATIKVHRVRYLEARSSFILVFFLDPTGTGERKAQVTVIAQHVLTEWWLADP